MLKCPSRASCGLGVVVVVDNNSMDLQKPLQVDRFWRRYCNEELSWSSIRKSALILVELQDRKSQVQLYLATISIGGTHIEIRYPLLLVLKIL